MAKSDPVEPVGEKRLPTVIALLITVLLVASYVVNAMDRQVFPVLLPTVDKVFHFTLPQGGLLSTIFTLGVGLSGIPAGYMMDRMSRKWVMICGVVVYSLFTLLTVLSLGFGDMMFYRFGSGVGEGLQTTAIYSAVGAYFYTYRAMAMGSMVSAFGIGGFLGPTIGAGLMVASGNWKVPLLAFGLLGLVFAGLLALLVPKLFSEKQNIGDSAQAVILDRIPNILWNRNIVLGTIVGVIVGLTEYGYIGLYSTFLIKHLAFDPKSAALAFSMFGVGALVAGIPAGFVGDRLPQKIVLSIGFACCAVIGFLVFNVVHSLGAQMVLSFCQGVFAAGLLYTNTYSMMQRSVQPTFVSRASGIYVAAAYLPAAFAGYFFAKLVGSLGWGGGEIVMLTLLPVLGIVAVLSIDGAKLLRGKMTA